MSLPNSSLANYRLRQERIARGWRQQDVADQLGTSVLTVKRWERGSHRPSAYFRAKLCILFEKSAEELGLINGDPLFAGDQKKTAGTVQTALSLKDERAVWTVPSPRNPHFTGREDLLDQLERYFSSQGKDKLATTQYVALTRPLALKGLGGIGKTQIAVEYAYRACEQGRFTHVLWINAVDQEAILSSFVALAELLPAFAARGETDQQKLLEAVKCWLEQCPQSWLLIFDNADEISVLQPYLPRRGNGSVLLTTRAHAVGSLAASIEVENMGLVEGTLLLLHRAQHQHASNEERNEAMNVVIALDGFPLALDQAGAYIEETGCSFVDYLQTYQEHHQTLLARRGRQATNYPDSVATTWSLSFEKIAASNPAAAELLRLCAFLAPDAIPEELLAEGAVYWPPALQQTVRDRFLFHQALENLLRFSLIKRLKEERFLSLHRLVQVVQRDTMETEEQCRWAERVVRAISAVFPETFEMTTLPRCWRFLSQAQACSLLIQDFAFTFAEAVSLLLRTASYLQEYALYEQAEVLYRRAARIQEQEFGPEHSEVARSLASLADLYGQQGKYEQAEQVFQRALRILEQTPESDHSPMAQALGGLAILTLKQGKYEQAEPLFQRALRILEQVLGREHPDGAYLLNGLAILYQNQGKYEQAEQVFQRALRILEQALGHEHPDVARPLNNLAELYREQGKYKQAELLSQRTLRIWEQALGPNHSNVARPLNNLAELYREQEKYEQAEQHQQRALHILEHTLGAGHPHVAQVLGGLANIYNAQGRNAQAEPLYQRALRIQEHTLGERHPETAKTLHDFATFQQAQGKSQEAAVLYQRALAIREQVLGVQHPKTEETRAAYAALIQRLAYGQQSDVRDALAESSQSEQVGNGAGSPGEWRRDLPLMPPCPRCQSHTAVSKNGTNRSGTQRFRCRLCSHSFTPHSRQQGYDSSLKEHAVALREQGKSYRSIARQLGMTHRTIRAWVKANKKNDIESV